LARNRKQGEKEIKKNIREDKGKTKEKQTGKRNPSPDLHIADMIGRYLRQPTLH
jgi:hypothetical protein